MPEVLAVTWSGEGQAEEVDLHGDITVHASATTVATVAAVHLNSDGSGWVRVMRNNRTVHAYSFPPESEPT